MIRAEEVFKIGRFIKPHGIKGEINLNFENDIFDRTDCPYLICLIDGIFVPFFIKEYRFKNNETALVMLESVASDVQAKQLCGFDVYFPRKYFEGNDEAQYSLEYFIGFQVVDTVKGDIGVITEIDQSTINTLFLLEDNAGNEIIIPASDDFVVNIDPKKKTLLLTLPEGLLD